MISYDLAKELKDAGFPQGSATGDHHDGGKWIEAEGTTYHHEIGDDTECYIPTLSELIAACGDEFSGLIKQSDWLAIGMRQDTQQTGATPEEAVAHLWIALHVDKDSALPA